MYRSHKKPFFSIDGARAVIRCFKLQNRLKTFTKNTMQMFKKFKIWLRAYKIMLIKAENYWWNEHCVKNWGMTWKEIQDMCED